MIFYLLLPDWLKKKWIQNYEIKADLAYRLGKTDEVIEYTSKCLKINDKNYYALNLRGLSYYDLQEWELALQDFNAAITLVPDSCPAICNKGLLKLKMKDYLSALKHFEYALTLEKED